MFLKTNINTLMSAPFISKACKMQSYSYKQATNRRLAPLFIKKNQTWSITH